MADILFSFGSFSATEATAKAVTAAGQSLFSAMFGAGTVEVSLPKSRAADLATFCERKGLTVL